MLRTEIWQDDIASPNDRLKEIFQLFPPEDMEDANQALSVYMRYWNSISSFVSEIPAFAGEDQNERVNSLIQAMKKSLGPENFAATVMDHTEMSLEQLYDHLRIPADAADREERLQARLDHFFHGQCFSKEIMELHNLIKKDHDEELPVAEAEITCRKLILFSIRMDEIRKKKMMIRQSMGKSVMKQPCPCGSGLKYRQCCFL